MGRFQLSNKSSNTWEINSDLAYYANKHIKATVSNQTLTESVLSENPIKGTFIFNESDSLLDP